MRHIVKPQPPRPDEAREITASCDRIGTQALLELGREHRMHPISGACNMAEWFVFALSEVDRDAAAGYVRAVLATIEASADARDEAERLRMEAFDRLAYVAHLRSASHGGRA